MATAGDQVGKRRWARAIWLRSLGALLLCGGVGLGLHVSVHGGPRASVPEIVWEMHHDVALSRARGEHRPLVLDFTAAWCQPCQELERVTYVNLGVRREAMRFVMAKIDCTTMDPPIQALFERYKIIGLPTVLFFDSQGNLLIQPRITGFVGPERFLEVLSNVR